ncbi:hypothetical protein CVT24_004601 [Panaeolus cyanescens]|uniref:DUF3533 domain-containing protein n=1 Tax=Panaeolus cyanescens TaxID=181874 RepID=A0A409YBD1_9AGAR|nr:hypothetical protein CVT24_004601 [Panaeolus cyanescens]
MSDSHSSHHVEKAPSQPQPHNSFFEGSQDARTARSTYLKMMVGIFFATTFIIFTIFPLFWGSIYKTPAHNLKGYLVDFDGGLVGQGVMAAMTAQPEAQKITWEVLPSSTFPGGPEEVGARVFDEEAWIAVVANPNASARLASAIANPDPSYDGSLAVTVFAVEARLESAYRGLLIPSTQARLIGVGRASSVQVMQSAVSSGVNVSAIVAASPQTLASPVGFTIRNLAPYDQQMAFGVTFIGLIFQMILAIFIVMGSMGAREKAGLTQRLQTGSMIMLRFATLFLAYFFLSLLYSLLAMGFGLEFGKKFGHAGFVIFWMLNWSNMLALGLAVEAVVLALPLPLVPFLIMLLIISNVAVVANPIEVLPHIYRYGYAMPFYNMSKGIRTILFATHNQVGMTFGILWAWIILSCITVPVFQILNRRRNASPSQKENTPAQDDKLQTDNA